MRFFVVAMVMLVASANAWFFGRNDETTATADGRPVDQSCVAEANEGTCAFFNCFEQRLPCGREFYMQRLGNHYCNRFERYFDTFTEEGQQFLTSSQQCVTAGLVEYYNRDYVNCHDLEHDAITLFGSCYRDHGFCDIIGDNSNQFLQVFRVSDLFGAGSGKLWREIMSLARGCGGRALTQFFRATSARLSPIRALFGGDDDDDEDDVVDK